MNEVNKEKLKALILAEQDKLKLKYILLDKQKRIDFIQKQTDLLFDYQDVVTSSETLIYHDLIEEQKMLCSKINLEIIKIKIKR